MSNDRASQRVNDASCYVLQTTPWRETSVIAKVFSRDYGLLPVVAKGAKRPFSTLRIVLQVFQPLLLSWTGKAEVKILTHAETKGFHLLPARSLMACWYMNELILRFLPKEDPHPELFDAYALALDSLASGKSQNTTLRRFEWELLKQTGYGIDAPTPDFDDPVQIEMVRKLIRQRLDQQLENVDLSSRKVMLSLRQASQET